MIDKTLTRLPKQGQLKSDWGVTTWYAWFDWFFVTNNFDEDDDCKGNVNWSHLYSQRIFNIWAHQWAHETWSLVSSIKRENICVEKMLTRSMY